ncbi:MAG: DUF2452 domain-containing protein [Gammaproteobacteria bacterium]|nr:DUF2452 domain-containing protein [Gammaproteobacteria bacterium]
MSDEENIKYTGKKHILADNTSPYPVSRLAPSIELIDLARQISHADTLISTQTNAKLQVIADQIKFLQDEARQILENAKRNQELHHVNCQFKRLPGNIYHLYRKNNGEQYFSMVSPEEWNGQPPHIYIGSYQLGTDMNWTEISA